jgi:hypothetical protein
MAIIDRPMGLVEEAGAVKKVSQARAFKAVSSPLDFRCRTPPAFRWNIGQ